MQIHSELVMAQLVTVQQLDMAKIVVEKNE